MLGWCPPWCQESAVACRCDLKSTPMAGWCFSQPTHGACDAFLSQRTVLAMHGSWKRMSKTSGQHLIPPNLQKPGARFIASSRAGRSNGVASLHASFLKVGFAGAAWAVQAEGPVPCLVSWLHLRPRSRSLGDLLAKEVGVTAVPDVAVVEAVVFFGAQIGVGTGFHFWTAPR